MDWGRKEQRDSSLGALTPEGIEFVLFPAGLPIRTCAYGIDKIIQWAVLLAISIAAVHKLGFWLVFLLNFCIDWFYHVICELAFRGQSPGKRIMGIRVVRSSGAPVDPASSFLRNLLRFADTFLCLFPIAFVSMAASQGFRRLGDWAGGTLVVYTPKSSAYPHHPAAYWFSSLVPIAPPYQLSHNEKQAIVMFARRYPLLGEARANEIARSYTRYLRPVSSGAADGPAANGISDAAYLLGLARRFSGDAPVRSDP